MGCAGSKQEESQAVALCRFRCQHLEHAIEFRYALAQAHASYVRSLRSLGPSLHRFFVAADHAPAPPSPLLTLPGHRKGDPFPPISHLSPPPPAAAAAAATLPPAATPPAAVVHRSSHSNSGHLEFLSSEGDDDDDDDDGPLHSDQSSPLHHHLGPEDFTTTTTTKTFFNFAQKGPPASSVVYEQRPFNPDVAPVQVGGFGDPSGASSSYPYYYGGGDPYANQNPNYYGGGGATAANTAYPYPYSYPPGYGAMGGGGVFGSSPPREPVPQQRPPSPPESRPPPAPPSPKASTWDFLNPFESYQSYYQAYTPSRSSRELREEEGIPDLEEEEHEVVKEAYGDYKSAAGASTSAADGVSSSKAVGLEEDGRRSVGEEMHYKVRPSNAGEGSEYDVHMVNRSVDEVQQRQSEEGLRRKVVPGSRSVSDAVQEIKAQFDRASVTCEEVSKMLEVGKQRYHGKKYQVVPTRVRYAITPSLSSTSSSMPSTSKSSEISDTASSVFSELEEEKCISSTLQKLHMWEKKLHDEVKSEEDMRLLHERQCKKLKRLDERGAEADKILSTREVVKKLSTKIRIVLQVVDSIASRISKLRDEELWPQLNELIQGLVKMWQVMTECHKIQYQAVLEAKGLDAVSAIGKPSDLHLQATMQLILDLLDWSEMFYSWVMAQKSFVRSLNDWLTKWLLDEPEVTADGVAPFSPGRMGAPPVFVICNYWSQAINVVSEGEVVQAMQSFTTNVLHIWQQHYANQRMLMSQTMDRRLKDLEKDNERIFKAVDAVNKRHTQVRGSSGLPYAGEVISLNLNAESSSLHLSLQQFFEAMERFSDSSTRAYMGLRARCEEEIAAK